MAAVATYRVGDDLLTGDEMVRLGGQSPEMFYRLFFPRTVRQPSAPFHLQLDAALDNPNYRFILAMMFRDAAKTTRLRLNIARRVAYGMSKTVFYVGGNEPAAARSVKWLRKQIEVNKTYASVFGLVAGSKWTETELEIQSTVTGDTAWVLGAGYTGSLRGINFDDYRPDFIVVDDIIDEENSGTKEQRTVVHNLLHGAIKGSLTPRSEDPNAKMIVAQTPLHQEDAAAKLESHPQFHVIKIPIWTDATVDAPLMKQESRWPERYPSVEVRADKAAAIAANELSIWTREKEVKLISPERRKFQPSWLKQLDIMPRTWNILAIDPLPPPSDREVEKGMADKDYECLMVIGRYEDGYYCKEYAVNQGHDPTWTIAEFFRLMQEHHCMKVVIHAIAYEKTLKWILQQEMKRRHQYYMVDLLKGDQRPKHVRIVSTLGGLGQNGQLYCKPEHTELIQQWNDYDQVAHEDVLETFSIGISKIANPVLEAGADNYLKQAPANQNYRIPNLRGAP